MQSKPSGALGQYFLWEPVNNFLPEMEFPRTHNLTQITHNSSLQHQDISPTPVKQKLSSENS
jgi:hypothetical protein